MRRYIGVCLPALLAVTPFLWAAGRYTLVFKNGAQSEISDCRRNGDYIIATNTVGIEFKFDIAKEIDVENTLKANEGHPPPCFYKPVVRTPAKEEYRVVHFMEGSSDYHCLGSLTKRPNGFFYQGNIMRGTSVIGKHEFAIPLDEIREVREDSFYEKYKGAGNKTWVRDKRQGAVNIFMKDGQVHEFNYYAEPGTLVSHPPLITLFPDEVVKRKRAK